MGEQTSFKVGDVQEIKALIFALDGGHPDTGFYSDAWMATDVHGIAVFLMRCPGRGVDACEVAAHALFDAGWKCSMTPFDARRMLPNQGPADTLPALASSAT